MVPLSVKLKSYGQGKLSIKGRSSVLLPACFFYLILKFNRE